MTMLKRLKKRQNFDNIEENSGYSRLQSKNMTMIVLDEEMIYCDNIEDIEDSDRFVFLSRHVSQSKKPTLTSHFLGNPSNEAPYGGEKMQIAATGCCHPSHQDFTSGGKIDSAQNLGGSEMF